MSEESGYTVRDRRRVTPEGEAAEKEEEGPGKIETEEDTTGRDAGQARRGLPPVDFGGFVLGLGEMALIHLGELPEPQTGKAAPDLEQARHMIDLLDMLETKTRGNLSQDEEQLLKGLVGDLKLRYVRLAK
jgi:hypothetical protein